jgi:hypothetical protein
LGDLTISHFINFFALTGQEMTNEENEIYERKKAKEKE